MFECGRSQISSLLKNKESIFELYEANAASESVSSRSKHSMSGTCLPVPRIFTQLAHNCARRPKKLLSVFKGRALRPQMDGLIDGKGGITLSR